MSDTPTSIYNEIRDLSFDNDVSLISESSLYTLMTQAETIFAKKINCTKTTTTDNSVVDQREYDRPTDALKILRVTWNTVKLKKVSLEDIDSTEGQSYGGVTSTGNVIYYYEYGDKIGLSPIPTEVQEIKYWYTKQPTALTASSTAFTIPDEYAHCLIDYCLWKIYTKDDKLQLANMSMNDWFNNLVQSQEDFIDVESSDEIETVQLEEIYNDTELGMA